jgi:hypothetical protein
MNPTKVLRKIGGIPRDDVMFAYTQNGFLYVTDGPRAHCHIEIPDPDKHLYHNHPDGWGVQTRRYDGEWVAVNPKELIYKMQAVIHWDTEPTAKAVLVPIPRDWRKRVKAEAGLGPKDSISVVLENGRVGWIDNNARGKDFIPAKESEVFASVVVPPTMPNIWVNLEFWNDAVKVAGVGAPVRVPEDVYRPVLLGSSYILPHAVVMRLTRRY